MREILFRGKQLISRDWIYGDLRQAYNKNGEIVHFAIADQKFQYKNTIVIPETLGQFTGMTDGTGEKIFEGDICELEDDDGNTSRFTVVWDKFRFRVVQGDIFYYDLNEDFCNRAAVVGNIHDNAE
jgi:uncharacterized phage protein (TIGR01671 family)